MRRAVRAIGIVLCGAFGIAACASAVRAATAVREARRVDSAIEHQSGDRIEERYRALQRETEELERLAEQRRPDEPCSVDVSAEARAMQEEADRHSVRLVRVTADAAGGSIGISGFGSGPAVREWIRRTDDMVSTGCAAVTRFELAASGVSAASGMTASEASAPGVSSSGVRVELVVRYRSDAERPADMPRSTLQAAVDSWPGAHPSQFAAAFGRDTPSALAARIAAPDPAPDGPAAASFPHPYRVTYLGSVSYAHESVTGITERFAVRIEPDGVVAALGIGETAFGWSVVEADAATLLVERKGVTYEVDRLSRDAGDRARRLHGHP